MSKWTIYDRYGVAKLEASNLEYHDSWMGEEFVNVSISSATPINLEIGDFLTYRGLTYTIYSLPTALKQARSGSTGDAFKYDNVKFSARSTELTEIRFFDIVLNDNELHYTSLPTFSFYAETVDDFLDRIQANTDRDGGHQWIIVSPNYTRTIGRYPSGSPARAAAQLLWEETFGTNHSTPSNADLSKVKNNVNISIDKQSIFDSLQHIKNSFGLNFITKERTIVVGGEGIAAGHLFQYGKGKGLYQIERSADADQQVVTKLYAYGSDKNIPTRYYADLGKTCYVNSDSPITTRISDDVQVWIEADIVQDRYYTKVSTFDPEIKLVKLSCDGITVQGYLYNEKIQVYYNPNYYHDYHERSYENAVAFANAINGKTRCAIVDGINTEIWPADHVDYSTAFQPNNMAVNVLMLPGYPKESLYNLCRYRIVDSSTPGSKKTIYEIRKTVTSPYQTLMEVEGEFPIAFSTERLRPYLYSQNVSTLGVKEGDIHFVEENDDNGLKEVYPSVEGMTEDDVFNNGSSARLDVIVACESITDDGRYRTDDPDYKFPNFHITIPNLGFDLKQTAEDSGGDVTISLTDGYCGGRDFKVVDITQNNDLTWDLECERCPDDTLSLMFPYSDAASHGQTPSANEPYQIRTGDHYVLSGINIKETSYIWGASVEALRKAITWLLNNDFTRFTYLPRVDEIYMKRQDDLAQASQGAIASMHDTLKAGHLMLFQDTDLDVDGSVFIDSLTIKEEGNNGIPTYDVVLRNDKQVGTMQRVQNQLNSLTSFVAGGGGGYNAQQIRSLIRAYGAELFLSKLTDDTAQGFIHLLQGLQVGEQFVTGLLGEGGVFRMDDDGKTYIEADKMYVRMKAYFDSVEIREYKYTGGNRIASVAGNKAVRVEWIKIVDGQETILDQTTASPSSADFFRCYFRASDGEDTVRNNFVVGDMVYCHITSIAGGSDDPEQKGLNQKHYWRLCIGRNVEGTLTDDGEAWIDISNRSTETIDNVSYAGYQSGSDYPDAQDSMIQLGNVNDNTRQGAIIEFVTGANAPSYQIYQGIGADSSNIYSLNNKNQVGFGYNTATGHAYMNVFGDAYIGDRNGTTFVKYEQNNPTTHAPKLTIKAEIEAQSTIGGQSIDDYIAGNEAINNMIEGLQDQIDGAIETYFLEGTPSLQTPPVVNPQGGTYPNPWLDGTETAAEREKILNRHLSDMYYDIADPDDSQTSGFAYRFIKDANNNYTWQYIDDTAITAALAKAAQALSVADSKAKVFKTASGVLPPAPYSVNDIWVNATGTWGTGASAVTWSNEILKCITACPSTGTPDISHWDKASKYTDDTKYNNFITALLNGMPSGSNEATVEAALNAIKAALNQGTTISGGLVLSSLIGLRDSNDILWAGISGQYNSSALGNGIAAWYGGAMVDKEVATTATDYAKTLFRFDGSGYLASGNITWNENGAVTIKNITTLSDSQNSNILNELATFNSAFSFGTSGQGSTTALYVTPNVPFASLYIGTSNANAKAVATQEWVSQNYLTTAFFSSLFRVHRKVNGADTIISANGTVPSDNSVSIEAMFGFWTERYLSALGLNDNGGSSSVGVLNDLLDVTISNPSNGQALVYNGNAWVNGSAGVDMNTVWGYLAAATNEQINASHLSTALSGYAQTSQLSNYLPLTGGTLTSSLSRVLDVKSTNSGGTYIGIFDSTNKISEVGWWITLGTYLQNLHGSSKHTLNLTDDGYLKFDSNTVIHSGNWSSYIGTSSSYVGYATYATSAGSAPASDVYAWAKASTKPSYTLDEVSDGSTRKLANYLPLSGGTMTGRLIVDLDNDADASSADTGSVRIGTASGNHILIDGNEIIAASGTSAGRLHLQYNGGTVQIGNDNNVGVDIYGSLYVNGNVGIGTTSPSYKLDVNGSANATTLYENGSRVITSGNIGSQSVSYATSAGNASTVGGYGAGYINKEEDLGNTGDYYCSVFLLCRNTVQEYHINGIFFTYEYGYARFKCAEINVHRSYWPNGGNTIGNLVNRSDSRDGKFELCNVTYNGESWLAVKLERVMACNYKFLGLHNGDPIQRVDYYKSDTQSVLNQEVYNSISVIDANNIYCNASTATKLTTARTIWGQSFDGTGNVSGALTDVTKINFNSNSAIARGNKITGTLGEHDIAIHAYNNNDNSYKEIRAYCSKFTIAEGNVGIGTTSPSYKLHVSGDACITDCLTLSRQGDVGAGSAGTPALIVGGTQSQQHLEFDGNEILSKSNTTTSSMLYFQFDGGDVSMCAASSGNVGIGTESPSYKLHVNGKVGTSDNILVEKNDGWIGVKSPAANENYLFGASSTGYIWGTVNGVYLRFVNGSVGVGTSSPSYKLHVDGTFYASGNASVGGSLSVAEASSFSKSVTLGSVNQGGGQSGANLTVYGEISSPYPYYSASTKLVWNGLEFRGYNYSHSLKLTSSGEMYMVTSAFHVSGGIYSDSYVSALGQNTSSDIRLKDIKSDIALSIDSIANAPSVKYEWKDNRKLGLQAGSIAQYWQTVLPESVHKDNKGYLSMEYGVIALLASISNARKIKDHEHRIAQLEKENERLRTELERIKLA